MLSYDILSHVFYCYTERRYAECRCAQSHGALSAVGKFENSQKMAVNYKRSSLFIKVRTNKLI